MTTTGRLSAWAKVITVVCLGSIGSACEEDTATTGPATTSSCFIWSAGPVTCSSEGDSLAFGPVIVGNRLSVDFCIQNLDIRWGYSNPGPITFNVPASTCPNFSWTAGTWTLQPDELVTLNVRFHPQSKGVKKCVIRLSGCDDTSIKLSGEGIVEADGIPARLPAFGVTNSGSYEAMVAVAFDYRASFGASWERDTLAVVIPPTEYDEVRLPMNYRYGIENLIRDIEVHAQAATGVPADPWATVFQQTFPIPIEKCYELDGTATEPTWSERGCRFEARCSCFGNLP